MKNRRSFIRNAARLGLFGTAAVSSLIQDALAATPTPRPDGVVEAMGQLMINGTQAVAGAPVAAGDRIATGSGGGAVLHLAGDAFLLHANTRIELRTRSRALEVLYVLSGRILSVFGKRRADHALAIRTPAAMIGIRGTGMYLEVARRRDYFCLCYGKAIVEGPGLLQPAVIETRHHESAMWLERRGGVLRLDPAPFMNHTDDELIMLEALTGRASPFGSASY